MYLTHTVVVRFLAMRSKIGNIFSVKTIPPWVLIVYSFLTIGSTIEWMATRLSTLARLLEGVPHSARLSVALMVVGFTWLTLIVYWPEVKRLLGSRQRFPEDAPQIMVKYSFSFAGKTHGNPAELAMQWSDPLILENLRDYPAYKVKIQSIANNQYAAIFPRTIPIIVKGRPETVLPDMEKNGIAASALFAHALAPLFISSPLKNEQRLDYAKAGAFTIVPITVCYEDGDGRRAFRTIAKVRCNHAEASASVESYEFAWEPIKHDYA